MKLLRTTFYSGIVTLSRVASGFIVSKIIAIFTGPGGLAVVGALTNFINIVLTFANGGISNGVIKYTAEANSSSLDSGALFSTAVKISIFCSVLIGFPLIALASHISEIVFTTKIYSGPITVLGVTLVLYSLNSLMLAILNGKGQVKSLTIANAVGTLLGLSVTLLLVYYFEVIGALYALVLSQTLMFFTTGFFLWKAPWFSVSQFFLKFDRKVFQKLLAYSSMAIVTSLTMPMSQLILRNLISSDLGFNQAGLWQGLIRVSDGYLMVVTTSLSVYYLPKLASLIDEKEIRTEIYQGFKFIMPAVISGCGLIYISRSFIIEILYTKDFASMERLFFWQLVGDIFKIAAWILSYLMLAKAMTKAFIISEIAFCLVYISFGIWFLKVLGLQGITMAFAISYMLYFILMLIMFRRLLFTNFRITWRKFC